MRVCYFGTYTLEEGYPRNRVIIEGLRKNGVEVIECHEELWKGTSEKLEGIKDWFAIFKQTARILRTYLKLINKYRRVGNYDALIVGYAGHIDIFLAKILNLFRKKSLIFDAFLSLYDTAVMDRKIVSQNSLKARLLWWVDRWACKMADAVLLDTQAHVDYFVREFRLPPAKFHAIPVGSYLAPPKSSRTPLSQESITGNENQFEVLYFGSYIPLHGVDVILKAAKIIQDKGNGLPSVIPAKAGIQNAGRGLDSHSLLKACGDKLRGNDGQLEGVSDEPSMNPGSQKGMKIEGRVIARAEGPKQSLNVAGFGIASHPPDARNDNAEGFSGGSEVVFILVGTGQLLSAMKGLASRLKLKNVIFIDRFVREEELMGYIMEADICLGIFGQTDKAARVIPCKVYNCLAMGKPLITMSSPATEGVLVHKKNAFLCKPGDPETLAEAISMLKDQKVLRENMGMRGREYFQMNFSAESIGEKVLKVISSVK